jgi:hypothetical protein
MLASGYASTSLTILIEDLDLQIAKDVSRLLVISDSSFPRPAASGERLISFWPSAERIEVLHLVDADQGARRAAGGHCAV